MRDRFLTPGCVFGIVAFVPFVILLFMQRMILNALLTFLAVNWLWALVVVLICAAAAAMVFIEREGLAVVLAVAAVGALIVGPILTSHSRAASIYQSSVEVTDQAQVADYDQRAPFTVARARAASQVTNNGSLNDTTYLADTGVYGTPVSAQGMYAGYTQVIEQSIDLTTGRITTNTCDFDPDRAAMRLGGLLRHSLDRQINSVAGYGTLIDSNDSYAYCDGDTPVVVVPLTEYAGVPAHRVFAGVALYDGLTGRVTIETDPSDVPGPVYPLSLAEEQRASTAAASGLWRWMLGQSGYSLPTAPGQPETDEEGGDASNVSEYNLALADGSGAQYVSSLIPRDGGTRIVALTSVDSTTATAGELNPLTLIELTPQQQRDADGTVAQQVRNQYQSLGWASQLEVFEVAPVGDHMWAITIGYTQQLAYRVLFDSETGDMSITTVGSQDGDTSTDGDTDSDTDSGDLPDLDTLTDAELAQLLDRVSDEINERLND